MSKLKKAMDKAKEAREQDGPPPLQETESLEPAAEELETLWRAPERVNEEINPAYCQTRIMKVEERILRRNKIVSLFHEEAMTDQLKILHTQVLNQMEQIGGNSLLVTSANHGEGKTLTALNLAVSMSHKLDQTVLLVDADLRKPSVHRFLGLRPERGLTDYLLRRAEIPDILINPGIEKMVILPAGGKLTNSGELLGSPRMEALIKEMRERYPDRFLIFDSPPLLACADPLVLSRFVDGILLVAEAEKTPAKDVERAAELLKDRPLIGTVLNKARG